MKGKRKWGPDHATKGKKQQARGRVGRHAGMPSPTIITEATETITKRGRMERKWGYQKTDDLYQNETKKRNEGISLIKESKQYGKIV